MLAVTRGQRIYFAAVGVLALWVGIWGYFVPAEVDRAIPWLVPPLHARFIASFYLSGVVVCLGGICARTFAEVRTALLMIAIWTGMLLVISLFYLGDFDFSRNQVLIWFGAYIAYPLIASWWLWQSRAVHENRDPIAGPGLPAWVPRSLQAVGGALTALALALLLAPEFMRSVWPWKITRMLAQIYSGPLMSYGVSCWMLSRKRTWPELRVVVTGAFVLASGVLVASVLHRALLPAGNVATWVWFGGFALAAAVLGVLTVRARRADDLGEPA